MTSEMVKALVPYGIIGLAILAIVVLALRPTNLNSRKFVWVAMAIIAVLAVIDRVLQAPQLQAATASDIAKAPIPSAGLSWVETGLRADWSERDWANTSGFVPKYVVMPNGAAKDMSLCDESRAGSIAVCWDSRPSGYAEKITVTDIPRGTSPAQWCTYKDASVKLSTSPNGTAPGAVFLCARTVTRK